jgi:PKD repeat protein
VTVLNEPGTPESFCNAAPITIRDANSALPYPSTIAVSGVSAGSFKVTVTVRGINHQTLLDLDMLLAGPEGQTVMLMSDADGGADLQNATLTFDDDASSQIPATNLGILPSGSYRPTNVGSPDAMPAGAPAEPYGSSLAVFAGTNPNGTWSLFLRDDTILGGGTGSVTRGWCVNLAQTNAAPVANAGGPYSGAEGSPIEFDGTGSTDPDNNIASYAWNFGDGETGSGPTVQHTYANGGTYTVTLTVTDADGASDVATAPVAVTNVAPVVTSVLLPSDPVAVNAPVALGATFADAGTGDSHTGSFTLGAGGPVAPGVVVETNGSGSMSASVTFAQAGVYTITASVTDDDGGTGVRSSAVDVPAFVVVYDPTGSFVTGGGWISSPAGAYAAEPTFTGKASFGFVAKYKPGASTPSGNTEFQFKAGDLSFKSTSYDWLVVAATHAKYKGEGTINGAGSYGFMVTAVDGDGPGGGDADGFRIKIWDLTSGAIVYDNKIGEGDESAAATSLGGGSIVIHK